MILRKYLLLAFIVGCNTLLPAQTKRIEKIEKKGAELTIPYEKYILPNGLTLLVHEDHSDPIAHVDVTYHVGDARESQGKAGFAHFFEHMMFMASDHLGDGQLIKLITEAGGEFNGSTLEDRTNYFETLPSNQLELALWAEADRMGFLHDAVTQEKFNIQRTTVKNEYDQGVLNRPYGRVSEKEGETLYPYGHPLHPSQDWKKDIDATGIVDLQKFFLRWYGPNNAVLTIAGDVNTQEVVKLVEKYFGPINRGPEVDMPKKMPVSLDKDRYVSYEDNIRFPLIRLTYPTVPDFDPDLPALEVLASIFGEGNNSLFFKKFIKTQKAVRASVNNNNSELAGQITFLVSIPPRGGSLAETEQMIRATMAEFEARGVTDDDLKRFKSKYEVDLVNDMASISGKASKLARYQTFTGNANYITEEYHKYMKVSKEDVMRVYNKYVKGKPAVILSVYPTGKPEMVAKPDNYTLVRDPAKLVNRDEEFKNLVYKKPVDNFDRSKKPEAKNPITIKGPDYWQESLPNGLKIIGTYNSEIPSVTLQLSVEAGHRLLASNPSKAGLAKITASLLDEATQKYSSEQLSEELEKMGSEIDILVNDRYITYTVTSLTKNVDATLKLFEEKLLYPKLDAQDFARLKQQQLEEIANQGTQPGVIANNVYAKLLYGEGHILSQPVSGTAASVEKLTLDDVKKYYDMYFSPSISKLVLVGDVQKDEILGKLVFLKTWAKKEVKLPDELPHPSIEKTKIYLVDKENAAQSEIRIGYLALPFDATGDFYKMRIANYALGGNFNSRINHNLRETKAYTYGARCNFSGDKWTGPYTASSGVRANVSDSAVFEFMKEIKNYSDNGITPEELAFTRKAMGQSDALEYETASQKAGFIRQILEYNLDKTFVDKQSDILQQVTKPEIDALAKKYLPYNKMIILVVGDKAKIKEPLSRLGYEMVELDKSGVPIK